MFLNSLVVCDKVSIDNETKIVRFDMIKRFNNLDYCEKYINMDINEWSMVDQVNNICSNCSQSQCVCIQKICH